MASTEPVVPLPVPKLSYKEEALEIMREWQVEIAADRAVNPTEANGQTARQINLVIYELEAI